MYRAFTYIFFCLVLAFSTKVYSQGTPMATRGGTTVYVGPTDTLTVTGNVSVGVGSEIDVDGMIRIGGDFTNDGTYDQTGGITLMNGGSGTQDIKGENLFYDLVIQNTGTGITTVSGTQSVRNLFTLSGGIFSTNDSLIFVSTATATARMGPVTGTLIGKIFMQRYLTSGVTGWHMIGSAASGVTLEEWNDDFVTTGFSGSDFPNFPSPSNPFVSMYRYDETLAGTKDDGYVSPIDITDDIDTADGWWAYIGPVPITLDVHGPPHIGALTIPLPYTNYLSPPDDGWNCVSNPYPCELDWDHITVTKTNMDSAIYIWDADNQVYTSYVNGIGTNGGTRYIASSQAFWVKSKLGGGSVGLKETSKYTSGGIEFFRFERQYNPESLSLILSGNNYSDEAVLSFRPGASASYEGDKDAWKIYDTYAPAPILSIAIPDSFDYNDYSIQTVQELNGSMSIPIRARVKSNGTYTLTAGGFDDLPISSCIMLEDLQTGIITDLKQDTSYSFTENTSTIAPRFMLHIGAIVPDIDPVTCHDDTDGAIALSGFGQGPWTYLWQNTAGDTLSLISNSTLPDSIGPLAPGEYVYTVIDQSGMCGTFTDTVELLNPQPLSSSYTVQTAKCYNQNSGSVDLSVTGGVVPYYYDWSSGWGLQDPTNLVAGTYWVTVTDANGCTITENFISVPNAPVLTASFSLPNDTLYISEGGVLEPTNTSIGATSYLWDFGDGDTSNQADPLHTYSAPGFYSVTLTSSTDSCSTAVAHVVMVSMDPLNMDEFAISNESVTISQQGALLMLQFDLANASNVIIELFDNNGKLVERKTAHVSQNTVSLSTEEYSSSVYYLQLQTPNQTYRKKVVLAE